MPEYLSAFLVFARHILYLTRRLHDKRYLFALDVGIVIMPKYEIRNTKYEIRNTKYEIRNTKYEYGRYDSS